MTLSLPNQDVLLSLWSENKPACCQQLSVAKTWEEKQWKMRKHRISLVDLKLPLRVVSI